MKRGTLYVYLATWALSFPLWLVVRQAHLSNWMTLWAGIILGAGTGLGQQIGERWPR